MIRPLIALTLLAASLSSTAAFAAPYNAATCSSLYDAATCTSLSELVTNGANVDLTGHTITITSNTPIDTTGMTLNNPYSDGNIYINGGSQPTGNAGDGTSSGLGGGTVTVTPTFPVILVPLNPVTGISCPYTLNELRDPNRYLQSSVVSNLARRQACRKLLSAL